ncbi:MAG: hypothetical protein ABSD72_18965 [Terracidiphilus sp.]
MNRRPDETSLLNGISRLDANLWFGRCVTAARVMHEARLIQECVYSPQHIRRTHVELRFPPYVRARDSVHD